MQISKHSTQIDAPTDAKYYANKTATSRCWEWPWSAIGILRFGLGAIFIWSGGAKLLDPRHFAVIIESFGLISDGAVFPAALCLAGVELTAGLGLIFNMPWALGLVTGLLLLFMAVLGYGLWLGLDVDCGCFGPQDPEGEAYHGMRPALYRDMAMLILVGFLYHQRRKALRYPLKSSRQYPNTIKRR